MYQNLRFKGGGPSRKIFRTYIWGFYVSKNYIKKEKFWCRLEQNRTTGGRVARANAKSPKTDPNFENGHFSSLFKNFWTMCFVLIFYTHMPNFGVLGSKTVFLEPKTCFLAFRKYPFTQNKKIAKVHSRQTLLLLQFSIFFDGTNFFGITKKLRT